MGMKRSQGVGAGTINPQGNPLGHPVQVQYRERPKCVSYHKTKEKVQGVHLAR
jgi:hypothetical protein